VNAPAPHVPMKLRLRVEDDWPSILDVWVASWRATYPEIDFDARRDWLMRHVRDLEAVGGVTLCLFDAASTLDRAAFGRNRPNAENVIDPKSLERALCEKPAPTFSQRALAGFVVINPADGWLDQICVAPDRFGAGLGASLLSAARNISPNVIRLDVNADNLRAIRFYERNGFSRVGRGANTLSGRETIMMEWRPRR